MTHVREELALGSGRGLSALGCPLELLGPSALGDVDHHDEVALVRSGIGIQRVSSDLRPESSTATGAAQLLDREATPFDHGVIDGGENHRIDARCVEDITWALTNDLVKSELSDAQQGLIRPLDTPLRIGDNDPHGHLTRDSRQESDLPLNLTLHLGLTPDIDQVTRR